MRKISPCLWFDGKAEEAVKFYMSVFKDSKIINVLHYGEAGPGPQGSVLLVTVQLGDQEFIALNGGPHYTLSPALSMFVRCETQEEVDDLWEKLSAGGQKLGCGWVTDKYGVTWQIVPSVVDEMLQDKDAGKANRVMQALLKMEKLDIARLKQAYEQQ